MNSFLQPLVALADDPRRDRIFVSDLFHAMEGNAVVALILLFALPNLAPVPPGTSTILGTPLLFLTIEWALGKQPWLPGALARCSMTRINFASMIHRVAPWMERVDGMLKPAPGGMCRCDRGARSSTVVVKSANCTALANVTCSAPRVA